MTETLSLISVVVMALLLWREHRQRVEAEAQRVMDREWWQRQFNSLGEDFAALQAEHLRWSDRDEKGRFVNREKGGRCDGGAYSGAVGL